MCDLAEGSSVERKSAGALSEGQLTQEGKS